MKKYIAGGAAVVLLFLAVVLIIRGCSGGKEVDAAGYVQADLDLIFQGETQEARKFINASGADLEKVYDNAIAAFVENYLTGVSGTQEEFPETYEYLVKQIFSSMKYQVGEAEKIDSDTYEVTVKFQPVDVFTKFIPELQEEAERIEQDAADGKYTGTDEEIQESMLVDYMNCSYSLLESAYLDMDYGAQEEFVFTVTADEKKTLAMEEEEINGFIVRILALDKL